MDFNNQIRDGINYITTHYHEGDEGRRKSSEMAAKLITMLDAGKTGATGFVNQTSISRLYFLYYLCELVTHMSPDESAAFISVLFPRPMSKKAANLIGQLISLALSVR